MQNALPKFRSHVKLQGVGNTNAVKLGRCIKELERIYGISNGGDRRSDEFKNGVSEGTKFPLKTQAQLAEEVGMSVKHWRNIKNIEKLASLPKEVQQIVEDGKITSSTAELLLAIPKQTGNQYSASAERSEKAKSEVIAEMGYERHEASDYQQMAKHPEVVQKVIVIDSVSLT